MTEEDFDFEHHQQITAQRNFDKVNFGHWQIKTWYVSRAQVSCAQLRQVLLTVPAE